MASRKSPANGALVYKARDRSAPSCEPNSRQAPTTGLAYRAGRTKLDVLQRSVLFIGIGDNRDALTAKSRSSDLLWRVHEEVDRVAANLRIGIKTREESKPVHRHGDLTGFERVKGLAHVGVGVARRRRRLVQLLVELERLNRIRASSRHANHVVGTRLVFILEPPGIERAGCTHGNAFRATLGEDRRAVAGLTVNLTLLEELCNLQQLTL